MNPAVEIDEPNLQTGFDTPATSCRLPPVKLPLRFQKPRKSLSRSKANVQVVEQGSEPFLLSLLCCFSHTVQSLGHAFPALCREAECLAALMFSFICALPSPTSAGSFCFLVRLVHRYRRSAVRLLQHVHVRHCGLRPSRTGLPQLAKACWRISWFSVHVVLSACAGSLDYAGPDSHSRANAAAVLPSSTTEGSHDPDLPAFVGPRTGATLRRFGPAVAPRFLWECLTSKTVGWFPVPATSNAACGFPARLRAPVRFTARFICPRDGSRFRKWSAYQPIVVVQSKRPI